MDYWITYTLGEPQRHEFATLAEALHAAHNLRGAFHLLKVAVFSRYSGLVECR